MVIQPAPAKVNLGLAVHRRRPDGYHDISTLLLKISLVQKTIPVAAGLGGGSSDAAATLIGLNMLWQLGLSSTELAAYAARLGADVPFFLLPTVAAMGYGRGDDLEPVACPRTFYLVLVKPPIAVSTAWVYQQLRFELTAPPKDTTILKQCLESGDIEGLGAVCFNDLEAVVVRHVPVVQDVKRALMRPGVYGVCMSGSGPTVYALCPSWDVAHEFASAVRLR